MPFLSIITINYNNAAGLRKTLESVRFQTFKDYEHILVDGGSSDESVDVIEELLQDFEYAQHVSWWCSEPDKGIYNAMNKALSHAKGNFYLFLNSGDFLYSENSLMQISENLDFTKKNTIYYSDIFTQLNGKITGRIKQPNEISFEFLCKTSLSHQSSFFSSDLFIENKYDESYKICSDWKLYFESYIQGTEFIYLKTIFSVYDMSGISSMNSDLVRHERNKIVEGILPKGLQKDFKINVSDPLALWKYYGQCFLQKKRIYDFLIFIQKAIFKLLRILKVLKRIDV